LARKSILDFLKPRPQARARATLPETLVVACGGEDVPVAVTVRHDARRMILRIDRRSGIPALTLPRGIGRVPAERFLADHADWLRARLNARPARVPFLADAEIPFRGVMHRIVHRAPFRGETRAIEEDGQRVIVVHGDPRHIETRVERFLRKEAETAFVPAVARYAALLGVTHGRITLKDTRSRWGSCSAAGDLAFSWRLILAPPEILDYLAAHELAHRLEMNHSSRYWRHVARICPDYRSAEAWLNRHGAGLHLYGRG